jgi:hypothetical protein
MERLPPRKPPLQKVAEAMGLELQQLVEVLVEATFHDAMPCETRHFAELTEG